ncbi:MAG: helix-turn-helix domain-containing protein [Coraliomargaritaceae bacterium]
MKDINTEETIKSTELSILYHKPVLNKKEASIFLGVSKRHLDNLMERRSIPFSRLGGRIVFQKKRLIQLLDSTDSLGGMLNV